MNFDWVNAQAEGKDLEVLLASYDWKFNFSSLDVRFCKPLKWVSLHLSIFLENRTASGPSSRSEMRYMRQWS